MEGNHFIEGRRSICLQGICQCEQGDTVAINSNLLHPKRPGFKRRILPEYRKF